MPNAEKLYRNLVEIKSQTDALLAYANQTTGADDTRLGEAVMTLASGFGQDAEGGTSAYKKLGTFTINPNGTLNSCSIDINLLDYGKQEFIVLVKNNMKATNTTSLRIQDGGNFSGASFDAKSNIVYGMAHVTLIDGYVVGVSSIDSGYSKTITGITPNPRLQDSKKGKINVSFYPFTTEELTSTIDVYGR